MSRPEPELTSKILRHLIETCRDSEAGLLRAASRSQRTGLKEFLRAEGLQQALFAAELELELKKMGMSAKPWPRLPASLCGWKEIRGTRLLPVGDDTVLLLCERGEKAALGEYLTALQSDLPDGILELLKRQHSQLKEAYTRLDQIREQLRNDGQTQVWPGPDGRVNDNAEHRDL